MKNLLDPKIQRRYKTSKARMPKLLSLQAEDITESIAHIVHSPAHTNINDIQFTHCSGKCLLSIYIKPIIHEEH